MPDSAATILKFISSKRPMSFGASLSSALAPLARRYVAGVKLVDALSAAEGLSKQGFHITLDHIDRDATCEAAARNAADHHIVMLKALGEKGLERHVSLRPSRVGLSFNRGLCLQNIERIVRAAESAGGFVHVDMDGPDTTATILDLVRKAKHNRRTPAGISLLATLKRTSTDIVDLIEGETTIRLCDDIRGESEGAAFQGIDEVRREFATYAKRLLTSGLYHCFATHDPVLIDEIRMFAKKQKIGPDRFEFQMCLGTRPSLQRRLLAEGWTVRVRIPFGRRWITHMRRTIDEKGERARFFVNDLLGR